MSLRGKIAAGGLVLASAGLLSFLGIWEGSEKIVYPDKLANNLPTVCMGITKHTSPYPVVLGDYWSDSKCEEVEKAVISKGQLALADCITNKNLSQESFDALSSHAHNVGTPNTCASRAVGLINAGDIRAGCNALAHGPSGKPVWSYVRQPNGTYKFIQGLYNRRLAEVELCLSGLN